MVNFELSVNNLKEKIKGIKLPGTLEDLRYSVEYDKTTVEIPISGIPNSAVVLEVLGESEKPKLVLENGEEVDLLEDGSINVTTVTPAPAEHTAEPSSTVTPAPAEHTDPKASETGEHTDTTVTPAPAEHNTNPESAGSTVTPRSETELSRGTLNPSNTSEYHL